MGFSWPQHDGQGRFGDCLMGLTGSLGRGLAGAGIKGNADTNLHFISPWLGEWCIFLRGISTDRLQLPD
jgi:hypothetical protein